MQRYLILEFLRRSDTKWSISPVQLDKNEKRYKLSKNCSIHGKNYEISGLYNFWTTVKSKNPWCLKLKFWTLPGLATPLGSVYNEVTKFIQRYVYRGKKVEGIVKTRMKQYNETKTQTIQLILPDPNSLTQYIKRTYYWAHCMTTDIQKCDHIYLVRNVNKNLELSSLWGVTAINCLGQWANIEAPVHKHEPKLIKQLLLTMTDRKNWVLLS